MQKGRKKKKMKAGYLCGERFKISTASQRCALMEFINDNAVMIFDILEDYGHCSLQLEKTYEELLRIQREKVDVCHRHFIDLLVADTLDKTTAAPIILNLIEITREMEKISTSHVNYTGQQYRTGIDMATFLLAFLSEDGLEMQEFDRIVSKRD